MKVRVVQGFGLFGSFVLTNFSFLYKALGRRLFLLGLTASLLVANAASGQEQVERLRSPAVERFVVGGESHVSYVIRARKGQVMTVRLSWRHQHDKELGDNHAEFFVGDLPDFDGDGRVKFGKESADGRRWRGRIPRTGDYYIYVMAHPIAHYTLRVTVK